MLHPDGIEVYLKPAGEANEGLRYAEFTVQRDGSAAANHSDHERRCTILARDENFQVVVRCQPSFKMYGASALLIQTDDEYQAPWGARPLRMRIIQRSFAHEQIEVPTLGYYTIGWGKGNRSYRYRSLQMYRHVKSLRGDFDGAAVEKLSSSEWKARPGSILVCIRRGKAQWMDNKKDGSSNSPNGPGNPAQRREYKEDTCKSLKGEHGREYLFEFRYRSEACVREAATKHTSIEKAKGDLDNLVLVQDPDFVRNRERDKAKRETVGAAWLKKQADSAEGRESVSGNTGASSGGTQTGARSRLLTKKGKAADSPERPPSFCDCPVQHRIQRKRPTAPQEAGSAISGRSEAATQDTHSVSPACEDEEQSSVKPPQGPAKPSDEGFALPQATVCSKCSGLKVARPRRPTFLRRWRESATTPTSVDGDQDDEEPQMPATTKANTEEADQEDREDEIGRSEPMMLLPVVTDTTLLPETATQKASTSAETTQVNINAGPEHPLEPVTNPGTTPSTDSTLADTPGSQKRPASVGLEPPKAKRLRVDIDLTANGDNDDLVEIKKERAVSMSIKGGAAASVGEDEEELQEQLKRIQLQREVLELEKERMNVEAKLRKVRRVKATRKAFKVEEVIKLED